MKNNLFSIITATGSYIPSVVVQNEDHLQHEFYGPDMKKFDKTNEEIIRKLKKSDVRGQEVIFNVPSF